jgi:hypothetical protein
MRVEFVDTPSLPELRAIVAQRLQSYGAFEGCAAKDQRTILAQACLVIWHLTAGNQGRVILSGQNIQTCLFPVMYTPPLTSLFCLLMTSP